MTSSHPQPPHGSTTGMWLGLICLVHTVFGIAAGFMGVPSGPASGRSPLVEIWQLGILASIEPDLLRALWFWFMWFGFAAGLAGLFMHRVERLRGYLTRGELLMLLALGTSGVCFIPASGFWFVVLLAAIELWRHHLRSPRQTLTSA